MRVSLTNLLIFFSKIFAGMLLTIILFLIYSVLLYYTEMSTDHERTVVYVASLVGITFAGFLNAGGKKSNGWFHGSLAGIAYLTIILGINNVFGNWNVSGSLYIIFIYGVSTFCAGSLGGILGINLRQKLRE